MADPQWVGNVITALATISASGIAFFSAIKINQNNLQNERIKYENQITWEREKLLLNFNREDALIKSKLYNNVLKIDGEIGITTVFPAEFNIQLYRKEIRSILFNDYHLLEQEIKDILRDLDGEIQLFQITGHLHKEEIEKMCSLYIKLINKIDNNYRREEEKF